jgi:hypothetical protein
MAATASHVLDLTTTEPPLTIKIDGIPYIIRRSNDLTLFEFKTIERLVPRVSVLLELAALSDDEGKELSDSLGRVCRLALVAPDAVHDVLGDVHKLQIFTVFVTLLTPRLGRTRATTEAGRPHGAKPSRGSSGSMVATRSPGVLKSRSGRSART